jgi:hypothetical protein
MSDSAGKIVWRVRAKDDRPHAAAFDALVLPAERPSSDATKPLRLTNVDVPFERELPGLTLTVIVRGNDADASLVSECTLFGADGSRRALGVSRSTLAVFMCTETGLLVTGLPSPGSEQVPAT